jgi:ABC-type antimicrobial peptide transport system permease subunit
MVASLTFATSSEVKSQEKSLAILRAFGVTSFKITAIFQMRSIVQMGYSLFFSVFVFFGLRSIIYASFGSGELVEGMNIVISIRDLVLPALLTFVITQLVTFFVVMRWANRNKFVAEKLQGL